MRTFLLLNHSIQVYPWISTKSRPDLNIFLKMLLLLSIKGIKSNEKNGRKWRAHKVNGLFGSLERGRRNRCPLLYRHGSVRANACGYLLGTLWIKSIFWPLLFNDERDSWMKKRILGRPQKFKFWSTKYQMGWYFFGYTRYMTFIHWRACHYEFLCFLCFAQLRWSLWCLIYMG